MKRLLGGGYTQAEIAAAVHVSKRDVSECAKLLEERGLTAAELAAMGAASGNVASALEDLQTPSAKAAKALGEKYGVDLPIIDQVNLILFENKPAAEAVRDLMLRDRRDENGSFGWDRV